MLSSVLCSKFHVMMTSSFLWGSLPTIWIRFLVEVPSILQMMMSWSKWMPAYLKWAPSMIWSSSFTLTYSIYRPHWTSRRSSSKIKQWKIFFFSDSNLSILAWIAFALWEFLNYLGSCSCSLLNWSRMFFWILFCSLMIFSASSLACFGKLKVSLKS